MALKIELKPGERFILGSSVITNGDHRTRLFISGDAPILREKDILTKETADTPAKRIYLVVQLIYLDQDSRPHQDLYFDLVDDFLKAAPSSFPLIDTINNKILTGSLYHALKDAKMLIDYEQELIGHAQSGGNGLPKNEPGRSQSPGPGGNPADESGGSAPDTKG
ncbi:flagellar biosynthesis repressor FlbT [Breoghania sp. L-A4]|uniref:flagellar biosynthesis repressor FlbT n=1 Tax=Breoghania sp. L-A4 TaxID=2304600 RepID=UPI000E3607CE|nr:flagellar biosynthesis repressor FlbT [Breoghania sp. L-A4]AXS41222.1 flagellar biosynthesis repressor FlbT [Breoghania sp. L-A4]